jgi:hypothetical protein
MKLITYCRHARKRMKERVVTEEEVNFVLNRADYIENDVKDRKNAYKHMNGRFIRVTFKEENDNIFIITVTIRKKPFERLNL